MTENLQLIFTIFILLVAGGWVLFRGAKILKKFFGKGSSCSCSENGCSGCPLRKNDVTSPYGCELFRSGESKDCRHRRR